MRFSKRRIASLASLSLLALVWSGCEAKEQTEYVAGVSTQVKVPRDLTFVRLSVSVGGVRTFCRAYRVYDGRVQLPRSLGTYAQNDPKQSGVITYQIIGYTKPLQEGDELDDFACGDKVGETAGARILRRSRQPYVENEILFLPMPLKYSCYDVPCGDEQTCKGGVCTDATTDTATLRKFTPDLVDGTGGDCFSSSLCLGAALPAIPVNLADCTFAIPGTPSAPPVKEGFPNPFTTPVPGEGLNVEVAYDGGYVKEILDKDPDEGFSVPDATKPQQFRLAPGLCAMFKGTAPSGRRITAVRASPTCQPKNISQPICQADAFAQMGLTPEGVAQTAAGEGDGCTPVELKPPRTAMMFVIDDSKQHEKFFTGADVQAAVQLAIGDPSFYRADIGVTYTSGAPACGTTNASVAVPLEPAGTVVPKIKASIEAKATTVPAKPADEIPRFDEGLRIAYEAVNANPAYFRRAVVLIGNRDFAGAACVADAATQGANARATAAKPVETFVFDLAGNTNDPFPPDADVLAAAGGTAPAVDARGSNKAPAKDGFQHVLERLATCVYDAPASADALKDGDVLAYNDPSTTLVRNIPFDAACTDGSQNVSGWGRGADGRIYVCGQACTDYRVTLVNAGLVTLPFGQPAPAIPIFGHHAACAPKP